MVKNVFGLSTGTFNNNFTVDDSIQKVTFVHHSKSFCNREYLHKERDFDSRQCLFKWQFKARSSPLKYFISLTYFKNENRLDCLRLPWLTILLDTIWIKRSFKMKRNKKVTEINKSRERFFLLCSWLRLDWQ